MQRLAGAVSRTPKSITQSIHWLTHSVDASACPREAAREESECRVCQLERIQQAKQQREHHNYTRRYYYTSAPVAATHAQQHKNGCNGHQHRQQRRLQQLFDRAFDV